MLTDGECCVLEEGGSRETNHVEVTVGAYTLPEGLNTTHWVASGTPPMEIPNAVTRFGADYFIDPRFVDDETREDLDFCIIRLHSPVDDGVLPLLRGTSCRGFACDGHNQLVARMLYQSMRRCTQVLMNRCL